MLKLFSPTKLEELVAQGFKEKRVGNQVLVLENETQGIIYDKTQEKIIARYPLEHLQNGKRGY